MEFRRHSNGADAVSQNDPIELLSMNASESRSLSEHRENLEDHLRHVRDTGEPLFITEDGCTAAVVLSPQHYEELRTKAQLAEDVLAISRSIRDAEAGRVMDSRELKRRLSTKYGINFNK
jgi:prevent-host-death family protein